MIKRNERIGKMVAVVVLVIAALFMLNRAKYGYIYNDEPFILTLSHRLIKGDAFWLIKTPRLSWGQARL